MVTIFYILIGIIIIYELSWIYNYKEYTDNLEKDGSSEGLFHALMSAFTVAVCLFGLVSFQWHFFLLYFFIELLVFGALKKMLKITTRTRYIINLISSIMGFILFLFILLNKYHWGIESIGELINSFKSLI